jgi:hypothetical protein
MGDRIDGLTASVKEAGEVIADSSTGVLQGVIVATYPVFLMATVALLTVAVVRLPRRLIGGDSNA